MPVVLTVLYPQPTDARAFDAAYTAHEALLRANANIPEGQTPYTITRFAAGPEGPAPYYQMFQLPFPSADALQQGMASPAMQEVAADAVRISTGGPPVILVGAPAA
mgnify:CR=1 FL=1